MEDFENDFVNVQKDSTDAQCPNDTLREYSKSIKRK